MKNSNGKIIERIAKLEVRVEDIQNTLKDISNNHLKGIYEKLDELEDFKVKVMAYATIGAVIGSILVQLGIKWIIK